MSYYKYNKYKRKKKSKNKSLLQQATIDSNRYFVSLLSKRYNWNYYSKDDNNYRISFVDELRVYRIDVYLSTMTLGLLPLCVSSAEIWMKSMTVDTMEDVFKNPNLFDTTIYNSVADKK